MSRTKDVSWADTLDDLILLPWSQGQTFLQAKVPRGAVALMLLVKRRCCETHCIQIRCRFHLLQGVGYLELVLFIWLCRFLGRHPAIRLPFLGLGCQTVESNSIGDVGYFQVKFGLAAKGDLRGVGVAYCSEVVDAGFL